MRTRGHSGIIGAVYTFVGALLIVAVWWIAAAAYGKPIIFPTPAEAVRTLFEEFASAYFWRAFGGSLLRSVIGFSAAAVLAVALVFLGKACPPIRKILAPVVGVLRSIPTMSVILLLVLWTSGNSAPVIVAGLVIFPVLYSGMDAALCSMPRELEETARLYADKPLYKFAKVYVPYAAPSFLTVAGGAASLTLKLTVAAEVLANTRYSLGFIMQQTRIYFEIGRLMALTVVVVVTALLLEFFVYLLRVAVDYN